MLPRRHRLTSSREFATTIRCGRRISSGRLVGHVWVPTAHDEHPGEPQVGLIVSKRVGSAVQRHRVSRVLRHAVAAHLGELPAGAVVVLRALPGAAGRDSMLATDVANILSRVSLG